MMIQKRQWARKTRMDMRCLYLHQLKRFWPPEAMLCPAWDRYAA